MSVANLQDRYADAVDDRRKQDRAGADVGMLANNRKSKCDQGQREENRAGKLDELCQQFWLVRFARLCLWLRRSEGRNKKQKWYFNEKWAITQIQRDSVVVVDRSGNRAYP